MAEESKQGRVVRSLNSNYGRLLNETEDKILKTVEENVYSITPKETAEKTGINHSYVRSCLRKLARLGFIHRKHYGQYEAVKNPTTLKGVGLDGGLPRLHRVLLVVRGVKGVPVGSHVAMDCELFTVKFVGFSDVVNVYVDCKGRYSFDYPAFCLLVGFVKAKLGVGDDAVVLVPNYELNEDYRGIQLDGCKALTLKAFDESFERLYNKDRDTLRSEVGLSNAAMTPERAYALLKGGVTPYNIFQSVYALIQEIKAEREIWKFIARYIIDREKKQHSNRVGREY